MVLEVEVGTTLGVKLLAKRAILKERPILESIAPAMNEKNSCCNNHDRLMSYEKRVVAC